MQLKSLLSLALLATSALAGPLAVDLSVESRAVPPTDFIKGKKFLIMPLGASITRGKGSSAGNGYRLRVFQKLEALGANYINFVGSLASGSMIHRHHEGHDGARIDEGWGFAQGVATSQRPNVILLFMGTNDMSQRFDLPHAPARMEALLDRLTAACPDATIVLAQITRDRDNAAMNAAIVTYGDALWDIVKRKVAAGKKIKIVDMRNILGPGDYNPAEGNHPNDSGYEKIAGKWIEALGWAARDGWIKEPVRLP